MKAGPIITMTAALAAATLAYSAPVTKHGAVEDDRLHLQRRSPSGNTPNRRPTNGNSRGRARAARPARPFTVIQDTRGNVHIDDAVGHNIQIPPRRITGGVHIGTDPANPNSVRIGNQHFTRQDGEHLSIAGTTFGREQSRHDTQGNVQQPASTASGLLGSIFGYFVTPRIVRGVPSNEHHTNSGHPFHTSSNDAYHHEGPHHITYSHPHPNVHIAPATIEGPIHIERNPNVRVTIAGVEYGEGHHHGPEEDVPADGSSSPRSH
jgi:hypothetical protein